VVAAVSFAPEAKKVLKVFVLLVLGIFLQTTFGNDLRVDDVAPDFMLLLAVCAGYVGGPDDGAVIGFACGLLSDLFLQSTPVGLSALAFCLVGFSVGWARANVLRPRLLLAPVLAAAGTMLGVVLFVVIGYVVGQQQLVAPGDRWLVELALVEALFAAVFALPAAVLMAWATQRPSASSTSVGLPVTASVMEASGRRRPLGPVRSRRRRRVRARVR
jgi:rod shape-determining protein MreD